MTLDRDDKEQIDMRIEHFLTQSLPEALKQHIASCPIAKKMIYGKGFIAGVAGICSLLGAVITLLITWRH